MRVILDTNVLVKAIGRQSAFRPLFDAFLAKCYDLVISTEILLEYEEVLSERNGPLVSTSILTVLLTRSNVRRQRISFDFRLVEQDPDDDKFVNAYIAGQADYLVPDDRHFRVVLASRFPTVRVVSTADFMELINR
ncbi:MAG: putative toxin-antitoxin system toxin component, PIN family [Cytophagaceae bacterium]|nr:MAG: putative toxin-antitoxin system toxin component, PIN family [Cytophagaceae bacterium]